MVKLEDVINEVNNMVVSGCNIKNVMWVVLSRYELAEKSTELSCKNDNIFYLSKFLNTKRDELFISSKNSNKRLEKKSIECMVRKLGRTNKIKAYPHKFRRTFATRALRNGMPITTLSKLMGHEKIETTMLYCQIDNSQIKMSYMQSAR